jgi:hypothetical protein
MSHRIIIRSKSLPAQGNLADAHTSGAAYELEFEPSHHLTEQQVGARVAKAMKKLEKLSQELTAETDEPTG